ncbi:MAG: M23 family metallopeptidase [Myxococcales bacterium]
MLSLAAPAFADPPAGTKQAQAARAGQGPRLLEARFEHGLAVTVRPAHVAPGELFQVDLRGQGLSSASFSFAGHSFRLFEIEKGHLRGYGAVPVSQAPGQLPLKIRATALSTERSGELELAVDEREFAESTLRVAKRFTSPSKKQKARMRADRRAFLAAYRVGFGAPHFASNFMNPVAPDAKINSVFGVRRVFNGKLQSRHMGLDIDGTTGTPIYAANDGLVRMVHNGFSAGNTVLVSHGAGLFTGYFHLSKFAVKKGQRVKKGQLIGLMGKTGRVTGPHLHFSAKLGEITIDPAALLSFDFFPDAAQVAGFEASE